MIKFILLFVIGVLLMGTAIYYTLSAVTDEMAKCQPGVVTKYNDGKKTTTVECTR